MKYPATIALLGLLLASAAPAMAQDLSPKPASAATIAAQARARAALPADDGADLEFARRGFVATLADPVIRDAKGTAIWNLRDYDFLKGDAPPTVNPSLWRHQGVLREHGLFQVTDGVWQVRGFDTANMTLIAGKTGWIIIDPLTSPPLAKAALGLANDKLGKRPVAAVIYTHSHTDHFGGMRGLFEPGDTSYRTIPVIAPEHFTEEAASENVIAGAAMGRRAMFQFGMAIPAGPQGRMGIGIGPAVSFTEVTLVPPSDLIRKTGETRVVDGVELEFQMVPESEAPAELNVMLPRQRTLVIGEIATCSLHNILTPRGALVRNALRWSAYLDEALTLYGERSDQLVASHCWPRFGNGVIRDYLAVQRDNYKFLHDQTVRMMNNGETAPEIAEQLAPPPALAKEWSARGYYGTYRHNAKAIYQRYLGWYDANPANLNPLPPVERGKRYVAAMGGARKVIAEARRAMASGDYRWAADVLNHLVFADPQNMQARALLADSHEQLGYQAESALWRNMYLQAALELRTAPPAFNPSPSSDLAGAIPTQMLLDAIATRLLPDKIGDRAMTINVVLTDRNERARVVVSRAAMSSRLGETARQPDASIAGPRQLLLGLLYAGMPLAAMEQAGLKVEGDRGAVEALQAAIEPPTSAFPVITP